MTTKITAQKNGPYLVEGEFTLVDPTGVPLAVRGKKRSIALCRCGGSVTKPFCDGTHTKIGFKGAETAVNAPTNAG